MLRLGDALLVAAVGAAIWPWATGAYTAVEQQRMMQGFEKMADSVSSPGAETTPSAEPHLFDAPEMEGWETEDLPYWKALESGGAFARIVIPRIDLNAMVVKGVSKSDLKRGPGWLPDTALPGELGNVGISGHRTTYQAPFRHLDEIEPGDKVELHTPYRVYIYKVVRRFQVLPEEGHVMKPTPNATLTLTTCHPPFSDRERMVVTAELVEVLVVEDRPSDQGE